MLLSTALIAVLAIAGSWGPVGVTAARLTHSIAPTFSNLTLLQQRLVGRTGETTANLTILAHCGRRSGTSRGPGDDWFCTVDALIAQPGAVPFWGTPVTYDISVKSNGCYKAQAPPTSVGNLLMRDAPRPPSRQPAGHDLRLLQHDLTAPRASEPDMPPKWIGNPRRSGVSGQLRFRDSLHDARDDDHFIGGSSAV